LLGELVQCGVGRRQHHPRARRIRILSRELLRERDLGAEVVLEKVLVELEQHAFAITRGRRAAFCGV
jgi:hypothetical protein